MLRSTCDNSVIDNLLLMMIKMKTILIQCCCLIWWCIIFAYFSFQKTPPSIDEILTTSKGTTFYILRDPGEHGLVGSPESIKSMKTCVSFLTDKVGKYRVNNMAANLVSINWESADFGWFPIWYWRLSKLWKRNRGWFWNVFETIT